MNQIERIIELCGRPTPEDIAAIKSPFVSTMLESIPATKKRSFEEMFPTASPEALDLLKRTLLFNPDKRITSELGLY
jgi:mitogen-activated protein kinase 15